MPRLPRPAAVGLAVAVTAIVACSSGNRHADPLGSKTTLTVGFSWSATGSLAAEGKLMADGYRMWAAAVNARGGLKVGTHTFHVDLKALDDQSNAFNAARNVERLISEQHVDFVLGPNDDNAALAAEAVAERRRYVLVQAEPPGDEFYRRGYRYSIGVGPRPDVYAVTVAGFLGGQTPKPKLGIIYADDTASSGLATAVAARARERGLEVVEPKQVSGAAGDLSPVMAELTQQGAQALVVAAAPANAQALLRAAQQAGLQPSAAVFTADAPGAGSLSAPGTLAEHQFALVSWLSDSPGLRDDLFGTAADFAAAYRKAYGGDPDAHSALAAAGAELLGIAIQRANAIDQDAVLSVLRQLDVSTLTGSFKAAPDGSNANAVALLAQVQGGRLVTVYPDRYASMKPVYPAP